MQTYERIKSEGPAEAIAKSRWHVGQVARCTKLTAYPDHGRPRSYRVLPTFEPLVPEQEEDPTGLLDERPGTSHKSPHQPDYLGISPLVELPVKDDSA